MDDFGKLAGLCLNVKKTKAIWLGKWMNNKNKPQIFHGFIAQWKFLGFLTNLILARRFENSKLNWICGVQET